MHVLFRLIVDPSEDVFLARVSAQQACGAHFVSHDVWSAWLVWTISLSVYTFAFKAHFVALKLTSWI